MKRLSAKSAPAKVKMKPKKAAERINLQTKKCKTEKEQREGRRKWQKNSRLTCRK